MTISVRRLSRSRLTTRTTPTEEVFDPDELDRAEELQEDEELSEDVLDEDGSIWTEAQE